MNKNHDSESKDTPFMEDSYHIGPDGAGRIVGITHTPNEDTHVRFFGGIAFNPPAPIKKGRTYNIGINKGQPFCEEMEPVRNVQTFGYGSTEEKR